MMALLSTFLRKHRLQAIFLVSHIAWVLIVQATFSLMLMVWLIAQPLLGGPIAAILAVNVILASPVPLYLTLLIKDRRFGESIGYYKSESLLRLKPNCDTGNAASED